MLFRSSLQELNQRFYAWLSECYHTRIHNALGTTPETAFKSDSMPSRFVASDILARSFLHCEPRKTDKSGCISFQGSKYDLGVAFAGRQVDVVYDPVNIETLTIEAPDTLPFQVHRVQIGERVAPRPKRPELETVQVDRSRLLDAISDTFQEKGQHYRRAISYANEMGKE